MTAFAQPILNQPLNFISLSTAILFVLGAIGMPLEMLRVNMANAEKIDWTRFDLQDISVVTGVDDLDRIWAEYFVKIDDIVYVATQKQWESAKAHLELKTN